MDFLKGTKKLTVIVRYVICFVSSKSYLEVCVAYLLYDIDGLVQDCSNSIANALELLQSSLSHRYIL